MDNNFVVRSEFVHCRLFSRDSVVFEAYKEMNNEMFLKLLDLRII